MPARSYIVAWPDRDADRADADAGHALPTPDAAPAVRIFVIDSFPVMCALGTGPKRMAHCDRLSAEQLSPQRARAYIDSVRDQLHAHDVTAPYAEWWFMLSHDPFYSALYYGDAIPLKPIMRICIQTGVAAVLSGHAHSLQHIYRPAASVHETPLHQVRVARSRTRCAARCSAGSGRLGATTVHQRWRWVVRVGPYAGTAEARAGDLRKAGARLHEHHAARRATRNRDVLRCGRQPAAHGEHDQSASLGTGPAQGQADAPSRARRSRSAGAASVRRGACPALRPYRSPHRSALRMACFQA